MNGDEVLGNIIKEVFSPLYGLVASLAFVYFLYGVFMFMTNMDDPAKRTIGRTHMIYGTIGLFIIFSVGGILKLYSDIFSGLFIF